MDWIRECVALCGSSPEGNSSRKSCASVGRAFMDSLLLCALDISRESPYQRLLTGGLFHVSLGKLNWVISTYETINWKDTFAVTWVHSESNAIQLEHRPPGISAESPIESSVMLQTNLLKQPTADWCEGGWISESTAFELEFTFLVFAYIACTLESTFLVTWHRKTLKPWRHILRSLPWQSVIRRKAVQSWCKYTPTTRPTPISLGWLHMLEYCL